MTHYKVFYRYIHRLMLHICVEKYRYLNELLPINRRYDCISIPKISNSKEKLKRSGKKEKWKYQSLCLCCKNVKNWRIFSSQIN